MSIFAKIASGSLLFLISILPPVIAEAMPAATVPTVHRSDVVNVQTLCDYRGCFGFGPRQTYRPPTYRPPGYQPPVYYRPRAAGAPRLIYQPPTRTITRTPIVPAGKAPVLGTQHTDWCLARYRSYNRTTNLYRTYRGQSQVCRSPYH
jgi:hypothetical protein